MSEGSQHTGFRERVAQLAAFLKGAAHDLRSAARPGPRAWRGATLGVLVVLAAILLVAAVGLFAPGGPLWVLGGFVFFAASFAVVGALLTLLWRLVRVLPPSYVWAAAALLGVLVFMAMVGLSVVVGIIVAGIAVAGAASLAGAAVAAFTAPGWQQATRLRKGLVWAGALAGTAILVGSGVVLLGSGTELAPLPPGVPGVTPLDLPDPSEPGPYSVTMLTYGSGHDRHRAAYAGEVAWATEPVDGSGLVEGWSGLRTAYWGFGPDALPRNARVWLPVGEGPFPLVLILHGQHTMLEDSDPGYAYLGELLASRGLIVASVDENFLNLSPVIDLLFFAQLQGENDLRGWLLLEHLALWQTWNRTPGHPVNGKVDMDAIALIGHSRGGEAVAAAAALNTLPVYPDDATIPLDYNFGIRSVIGFAPVDGTYRPAGQSIPLTGINYLVLHGAHDMDVFTFQGLSQYARAVLPPDSDAFKAALYLYGANHGQFNSVWGRKDLFEPVMRIFNLEQLMPAAAQQQVAKTAISAFLDATLRDEPAYRAFFRDPRSGAAWLPDAVMLSQYQDAATLLLSTYEEDIDLTTTTAPGGHLAGEGLATWREGPLSAKWETRENQVVVLGWSAPVGRGAAMYTVTLPEGEVPGDVTAVVFAMADAGDPPDTGAAGTTGPTPDFIDLTLAVVDGDGDLAELPLSRVGVLRTQLKARLGKAAFFSPFSESEPVLQHFEVPLAAFVAENSAFDPASLREIRFVFDRTPSGSVVLDDIGLRAE